MIDIIDWNDLEKSDIKVILSRITYKDIVIIYISV